MAEFRYTRPDRFPPIVKNLIIINVLVWVAQLVLHKQFDLTSKLELYPIDTPDFKPYQIVTHMFAHASYASNGTIIFYHILFNMFTLWMFGRVLENVWGPKRFLIFYLVCGIGAAACHLLVQHLRYDPNIINQLNLAYDRGDKIFFDQNIGKAGFLAPALGASGAIMGVMAGFAFLFPNTEMMLLFLPVPIKAKYFILGLVLIDLFGGITNSSSDNIAHFAHLGGAITGFILVLIWNKTNRRTLY
ncbi:MAG TPA: rhomboid family intramembrane serine protease [Chitinophagaceae bacterium]|nr:rhomboid family intramembrane serine protease [Chitinophagaceae bacterium]